LFHDHRQMVISLCRHTWFVARDRRRARRDHHLDLVAMCRYRLVDGRAIIRAISRQLDNRIGLLDGRFGHQAIQLAA